MLPDIYDEMLKKLMRRTMKGEVHWRLSSQGDMFTVKFQAFALSMTRGANYINFIISDANDQGIDEFRVSNSDKEWDQIAAFYNQIRTKSPDINNAVKAIMTELEKEGSVGLKGADTHSEGNKKIYKLAG